MSALWVVSSVVLWVVVLIMVIFMIAILHRLGEIGAAVAIQNAQPVGQIPPIEHDGPPIGAAAPELAAVPLHDQAPLSLRSLVTSVQRTMVVFLSPTCESCQHVIDPLNDLVAQHRGEIAVLAIMRADLHGCQSFDSVFPSRFPLICDSERRITLDFDIHRNPFALLYDHEGVVTRKGVIMDEQDIQAILTGIDDRPGKEIFPSPSGATPDRVAAGS